MEIGNLLVWSGKAMVYYEMDFFRVPDLLDAHLTENLDRQRPRTVLGHGHVGRQDTNLPRTVDFPNSVRLDTDDLLRERKRIVAEDSLGQLSHEVHENCRY